MIGIHFLFRILVSLLPDKIFLCFYSVVCEVVVYEL